MSETVNSSPDIVVTGAAGFIGSQLLLELLTRQSSGTLLAVDHPLTERKASNREGVLGTVALVDHETFLGQLESGRIRPRTIYHMGACSSTTETNWDFLRRNNLEYSQRLWTWCESTGGRLIYASSAATYGDGAQGFDDESAIEALKPMNLYGRSKQEFDLWCQAKLREGRRLTQCVGLKFFNVFGPGEAHKGRMASMVFHGYHQIQSTGRMRLFQSHRPDFTHGGQRRDFVYVKDVVRMVCELGDRPEVSGLFNVGTGEARTFNDLARAIFSALGRAPDIEYIPMPEDLRSAYQYHTQATMRKLAATGVETRCRSLEDAVADYLQRCGASLKRAE